MKKILKKTFSNFAYFYSHLGYRLFITVGLSILVGVLDGFGLSMFLPLLNMVSGDKTSASGNTNMGKLEFIVEYIQKMGLPLTLSFVLIFMVLFFLLKGIAKYFSGRYRVAVQQYFIKKLRLKMLNSFNKMGFKEFITADIGTIQNTMSGEVDKMAKAFAMYFATFEQSILVVVYVAFAFFVDVRFAALVTMGGLLTNIVYNFFYKTTKDTSVKLTSKSNVYQGQIIQHVGNYKYLKATGLLSVYADKLKQTINLIEESRKKIGNISAFLQAAREPMLIGIVAIVIFLQVMVLNGSLGPILISLLFFYRALAALSNMQSNWNKFLENSGSMENIQEFQKMLTQSVAKNGKERMGKFNNSLELSEVILDFGDFRVLNSISLRIQKNESIAFVGESGSGKTTLVNVLTGLLKVDGGVFKIDGVDRNTLDINTYQERIGYVTQEPVIFNDTLFNNITFWAEPNAHNIERFNDVIENASLSQFIQDLQDGPETILGSNGINVSGGQRQRISIARELFKDIDILIMDEATSALDTETEKAIQESIDKLKGKYTIILVAHRLSTIKDVDRIVLMSKGNIMDINSFNALRENNMVFKSMVELQEMTTLS